MDEGSPSATAIGNAITRAAHVLLDDDPKVFEDTLALGLSGVSDAAALRGIVDALVAGVAGTATPDFAAMFFRQFRALQVLRSRYTEDELEQAIPHGIAQYVILGAGLDSFAYRRQDLSGVLQVFEVDHPATQQWKRARLRELQIAAPSNLVFVPLDFEKHALAEALRAGGYWPEKAAFFSWLGVTRYLTADSVFRTLRDVASVSAPGSEIVFDYSLPDELVDEEGRRFLAVLKGFGAASGEPWLSLFEPASLAARVEEVGFAEVWDFSPEEANARYFVGRMDGLRVPSIAHLMKARVGGV